MLSALFMISLLDRMTAMNTVQSSTDRATTSSKMPSRSGQRHQRPKAFQRAGSGAKMFPRRLLVFVLDVNDDWVLMGGTIPFTENDGLSDYQRC